MQRFTYSVVLTPDQKAGGFVETCRDVPEVVTQGETIEDAVNEAEGALEAAIEMRIEDGISIPVPSARKRGAHLACVPVGTAMLAALYVSMRKQNVSEKRGHGHISERKGAMIVFPDGNRECRCN